MDYMLKLCLTQRAGSKKGHGSIGEGSIPAKEIPNLILDLEAGRKENESLLNRIAVLTAEKISLNRLRNNIMSPWQRASNDITPAQIIRAPQRCTVCTE